jgi:hypothetical protein
MRKIMLSLALVLLMCGPVFAGGTVTKAGDKTIKGNQFTKGVRILQWNWETDAVSTTAATVTGEEYHNVTGRIMGIEAVPSTTAAPDDNYDIEIKAVTSNFDILNGAGDDLPNSVQSDENIRCPGDWKSGKDIPLVNKTIKFWGSGLGNSAAGTFYLYIELP